MVTNYSLQTKDHKIVIKDDDISVVEMETIKQSLRHYYRVLEEQYEKFVELEMIDIARDIKDKLEIVRQLRRKLDGRE